MSRKNISLKFINIISVDETGIKKVLASKIDSLTDKKNLICFFDALEIACNEDTIFRHLESVELNLATNKWIIYSTNKIKKLSVIGKITSLHFSANRKGISKIIYIDSMLGSILKVKKEKSFGIACYPKY